MQTKRMKRLLDEVFVEVGDDVTFISLTSHSGAIKAILKVLNHRPFKLHTGDVLPVFVKAKQRRQCM